MARWLTLKPPLLATMTKRYYAGPNGIRPLPTWLDGFYLGLGLKPEAVIKYRKAKFPSPFCPARTCFSERCLVIRHCPALAEITYEPEKLRLLLDNKEIKRSLLSIPTRTHCLQAAQYITALEQLLRELYSKQVSLYIGGRNAG